MAAITVVTIFDVSGDEIDQVIKLQDDCEAFVAAQEGFINSKFMRSQTGEDKYNVVSVSDWQSRESFDAAFSKPELADLVAHHPRFTHHRGFYEIIRDI